MTEEREPASPWVGPVLLGALASAVAGGAIIAGAYGLVFLEGLAGGRDNYGYWLFVFVPSVMGIAAAIAINLRRLRPSWFGYVTSLTTFLFSAFCMLVTRIEGLFCLGMAMPLLFPLYWAGYFGMRAFLKNRGPENAATMVSLVPLLALATVASARYSPPPGLRTETTTLDIDAPPEAIWPYLFEMDAIPPPDNVLLRNGVARPIRIASSGREVGASRQCVLSTGTMPETITASERERRLQFRVLETPASMVETNPFGAVDAPHLRGHFTVDTGEFRLIPLPNGRTRLVGTSTYRLRIQPVAYWYLWSDSVVEQVHLAVMGEIKRRVEAKRSL